MIDGYANPRAPKFFEALLPATRMDGTAIVYAGAVAVTINVRLPGQGTRRWSTDDATLTVVPSGGAMYARHTFASDGSDLPYHGEDPPTAHFHFDVDLSIDGVPEQVPSFCWELLNDRICR